MAFVGVAALLGPCGGITWGTLGSALLIRASWVAYTLARVALVHRYPYGFVNVWRLGYARVGVNIVAILIGALVFMGFFAAIDWAIRRTTRAGVHLPRVRVHAASGLAAPASKMSAGASRASGGRPTTDVRATPKVGAAALARSDGNRRHGDAVRLVGGPHVHEGDDAPVHVLLRVEQGLRG